MDKKTPGFGPRAAAIVTSKVNSGGAYECNDFHIFQTVMGRYTYMGVVPVSLGTLKKATKADIRRGEASPDIGGVMKTLKFPDFLTPYEAFMFAKGKGYISLSYLKVSVADKFYAAPVVCLDIETDVLFNPLDDKEEGRPGHVTRLEPEEIKQYKKLGLGRFIFWSVYETGMDSLSSLIGDYREESEAVKVRDDLYRKSMM